MKKVFSLLVFMALLSLDARAQPDSIEPPAPSDGPDIANPTNQTNQADLLTTLPELEARDLESLMKFQTSTISRVLGVDLTVDGVLPRFRRMENPLHLINPFAPARYGSGWDVTSVNPWTGRAEGIVLLGIKF
jgi:hypothetical protein